MQSRSLISGMIVSPHPLATEAGQAVLTDGGNAIEAAVAVASTLAVVMPHFCGLGGDAVWLVGDGDGNTRCFLGIGQAASRRTSKGPIPVRGPGSMLTTACAVDSWGHALTFSRENWDGNRNLSELLQPAITVAEDGYVPGKSQDFWLDFRKGEWPSWPGFESLFNHRSEDGLLCQPQLASSLRKIARDGYRSFYEGSLAAEIASGLASLGSPISSDDLASTRTREVETVSLDYRGHTLHAPPPPTQGLTTLAIMGILSHFDMAKFPPLSASRYHLLVEATKQAFLFRSSISDPAFSRESSEAQNALLHPERLRTAASSIDLDRALPWPNKANSADTVFFGVVDQQGRYASILQSTYFDWGSGAVVGDTGILWHNRGAAFSADPVHPNVYSPGKRPFYTLNPGIALRNGSPYLLYGTQGADGQPQTLSVLLTSLLDDRMSPDEALTVPRFLLGRTFSDSRDNLKLEGSLPHEITEDLRGAGHEVAVLPAFSPIFGQAGVIRIAGTGTVDGAHDPRGEGTAALAMDLESKR